MDHELRVRLYANDRLLKALIAVLALRDPDLLDDLKAIFEIAQTDNHEIGDNSAATWSEINRELSLISEMVGETADELSHEEDRLAS